MIRDGVNTKTILTAAEVAKMLNVSKATVYNGARTSQIPSVRVGHRILFPVDAIRNWLEVRSQDSLNEDD